MAEWRRLSSADAWRTMSSTGSVDSLIVCGSAHLVCSRVLVLCPRGRSAFLGRLSAAALHAEKPSPLARSAGLPLLSLYTSTTLTFLRAASSSSCAMALDRVSSTLFLVSAMLFVYAAGCE